MPDAFLSVFPDVPVLRKWESEPKIFRKQFFMGWLFLLQAKNREFRNKVRN